MINQGLPSAAHSVISHHDFDHTIVERIAGLFGVEAKLAPFQLPGGTVYQLTIPGESGQPVTMLTLWPSIHRVDAISPSSAVVFTDVRTVDLVGDIEVQFRRSNRDYLIIARNGKVIVRA